MRCHSKERVKMKWEILTAVEGLVFSSETITWEITDFTSWNAMGWWWRCLWKIVVVSFTLKEAVGWDVPVCREGRNKWTEPILSSTLTYDTQTKLDRLELKECEGIEWSWDPVLDNFHEYLKGILRFVLKQSNSGCLPTFPVCIHKRLNTRYSFTSFTSRSKRDFTH